MEGCGPLVTPAELERLSQANFGHLVMRHDHLGPYLGEQIDRYDAGQAAAVSETVRRSFGLEAILPQLLAVYEEAIADVAERPHTADEARAAERAYLGWIDRNYPAPVLEGHRTMARRVHELEYERHQLRSELRRLRAQRAVGIDRGLRSRVRRLRAWLAPTGSRRERGYATVRAVLTGRGRRKR